MKTRDTIETIAKTEFKLIGRKWTFRFLSLCIGIFVITQCIIFISNWKYSDWKCIALPSSVPFIAIYILNFTQVFLLFFIAGNFWKTDQRTDSSAVFFTRPFENSEYIFGKVIGLFLRICLLNTIILGIVLIIHLFASYSPFNFFYYPYYFVTLLLPTLVFYSGITLIVKNLVRHDGLAILLLLSIATLFFILALRGMYGTDIFAYEIPNVFSEIAIQNDYAFYLQQRLFILLVGIGIGFIGCNLSWRIPNHKRQLRHYFYIGWGVILLSQLWVVHHQLNRESTFSIRKEYKNTYRQYDAFPKSIITRHDITFRQIENRIEMESRLILKNESTQPITRQILYLNPGLKITRLLINDQAYKFTREHQVILLDKALSPGDSLRLQVQYKGQIDERICYPDMSPKEYLDRKLFPAYLPYRSERHYAYTGKAYTLLTPESVWYITSAPPVNITHPTKRRRQFTRYSLRVRNESLKRVISLGEARQEKNDVVYQGSHDYAALSLCIGPYERAFFNYRGLKLELYYLKEHDDYCRFFNRKELIQSLKIMFRYNSSTIEYWGGFPQRVALVESPLSFYALSREGKNGSEYAQSELLFVSERGIEQYQEIPSPTIREQEKDRSKTSDENPLNLIITKFIEQNRWNYRGSLLFQWLIPSQYEKEKNKRDIAPLLGEDMNFVDSEKYPAINTIFHQLKKQDDLMYPYPFLDFKRAIYDQLSNRSLSEIIRTDGQKPELLSEVLRLKANELKDRLFSIVPRDSVYRFLSRFFSERRYQRVPLQTFCDSCRKKFDIDFMALIQDLYENKTLPLFRITDVKFYRLQENEEYILTFKAWNQSNREGILKIHRSTPESWNTPLVEYIRMVPGEHNEYRLRWQGKTFNASVSTGISRNLPNIYFTTNKGPWDIHPQETSDFRQGIFDIDTSVFEPPANEIIVDNRDKGFHLIEKHSYFFRRLFRESVRWQSAYHASFYGDSIRDALFCKASNMGASAQWNSRLPREGIYEVFIYNPPHLLKEITILKKTKKEGYQNIGANSFKEYTQTYTIHHADGEEIIQLDLKNKTPGWVSVGKYRFTTDTAKIILHDQPPHPEFYIIADAVKWKKL